MNETKSPLNARHPLLLIHEAARVTPDDLGLVVDTKHYSFQEASVAIYSMADFLRARGVTSGDLVAIDLPMEFDLLAKHALFLLGATSCSVFGFLKVPEGLDPTWLVTVPGKHPLSENTLVVEPGSIPLNQNLGVADFDLSFVRADRPALLIYTSGTTGTNKAVVITDAQLGSRVQSYQQQRSPQALRLGLIYNSGVGLFTQLEQLSRLKPIVFASNRSDSILAVLEKVPVTGYVASPIQLMALLSYSEVAHQIRESEEFVITGSLVLPSQFEKLQSAAPKAKIRIFFGANETGAVAMSIRISSSHAALVGTPVAGAEIEVVDEAGMVVADGEIGIVRTKTTYMSNFYYNDIYESAKSFMSGWFYPGDMGYLDQEGNLYLAGRASDVINAGGVKINPHAIETKVLTLDGVVECAGVEVVGPNGVSAFGLAVVCEEEVDLVRLEKLLKSYFPFSPPTVYMQVAQLPRNQNGKIDRSVLRSMFQSPL
jgi:long-chain acyl-CoA synthetase